jgi:hypothetical protein
LLLFKTCLWDFCQGIKALKKQVYYLELVQTTEVAKMFKKQYDKSDNQPEIQ